jgi:steroid delta-isomerase-like uncharacterized protein
MRLSRLVSATTLCLAVAGCASSSAANLEANKELVRRFAEAGNAADWDALADVVAQDFTRHSAATAGPPVRSLDGFIEMQKAFLTSMPDQRATIDQMIAEGDYVAVRATYSGTLTGPMGDFPATGKAAEVPFLGMFRIANGKIAELWVEWDNVAMLTQLGLFPPPAPDEPTG